MDNAPEEVKTGSGLGTLKKYKFHHGLNKFHQPKAIC